MVKINDLVHTNQSIEFYTNLLTHMMQQQSTALINGNVEDFIKWFELDSYNEYYLRRWFNGYAVKFENPSECEYEIEGFREESSNRYYVKVTFRLKYKSYDAEDVTFSYVIIRDEEAFKIVSQTYKIHDKPWKDDETETKSFSIGSTGIIFRTESLNQEERYHNELLQSKEVIEIFKNSCDPLSANLYARAVSKSVRFRNTHPEIDCAAFLSDLMTLRVAKLSFLLGDCDFATYAKRINAFSKKNIISKTNEAQHNDGEISIRELSLLPQFNIDEVFASRNSEHFMEASCAELTSFYGSILRAGGMKGTNVFIVTQPFHYLTVFKLDKGYYIINVNDIMPMTENRLYGDNEVTRIFSPVYFLDSSGQSNMPFEVYEEVSKFFAKGIPLFKIPKMNKQVNTLPCGVEPEFSIKNCNTPIELSMKLKKYVLKMSKDWPYSPFTWAKYSYQTLLVDKLQAYLISSIKAMECIKAANLYNSIEELFDWIRKNIKPGSIFPENDRLMTADQVLRNRKGNPKDVALLISSLAILMKICKGAGIAISDRTAYAVLFDGDGEVIIYNAQTLERVSKINETVIFAFDENVGYSIYKMNENTPVWLQKII
ncbi:MAG TPA: hypothetical protein GXX73_00660 [Clostridium sp.]|nr:hypothetical protein [Clostridium sp.]